MSDIWATLTPLRCKAAVWFGHYTAGVVFPRQLSCGEGIHLCGGSLMNTISMAQFPWLQKLKFSYPG